MRDAQDIQKKQQQLTYIAEVRKRSDRLINYFLAGYFLIGIFFAFYYDTWLIAFGIGGLCLGAYYSAKLLLPDSNLYQYVLSAVFGIFMAQFIYQMHGLFEMHFFAFIGSAILITYQKWKLQIPMVIVVVVHHSVFGYLQNSGFETIYFSQLDFFGLQTFILHVFLAAVIFFICGLWAYQLKKSNHQLECARREAEQANRAKSMFLATMSHEIRTPMNGVIGMSSLLAETPLTDQQRMYTRTISTCGETLVNVINDILDFSKIEAGNLELHKEDFDLRRCLEDILDIFSNKASTSGIELICQVDPKIPSLINGDDLRLRQVITNLVNNSIKFTSSGEVAIEAYMRKAKPNGELELEFVVRDTGIGIPPDKLERLFKAFSQVDSSTTRKYGGTGLGLAICEKLVKLMDGDIRVESEPGKGSAFSFTIQVTRAVKNPVNTFQNELLGQSGKVVLVIDDNETNRNILKEQLLGWKFKPRVANSAEEGLSLLFADPNIDLVLTDMQMPEMNGIAFAEEVRKQNINVPIILLSSVGCDYQKHVGLFSSVLTKPIKQHILSKHILAALDKLPEHGDSLTSPTKMPENLASLYPMQILVAEDNAINQQVILHVLRKLGYDPILVADGLKAVEETCRKDYDLILMDMQMPEMDGLQATKVIRETLSKQPAIIALTANAMAEDKEDCLKAGMDDYLGKPLNLDELVSKLQKWHTNKEFSKA